MAPTLLRLAAPNVLVMLLQAAVGTLGIANALAARLGAWR